MRAIRITRIPVAFVNVTVYLLGGISRLSPQGFVGACSRSFARENIMRPAVGGGANEKRLSSILGARSQARVAIYCGCVGSVLVVMTSLRGTGVSLFSIHTCQSTSAWRIAR